MERRTVQASISLEDLTRMLDLPPGLHVSHLLTRLDPPGVDIIVAGDTLPVVPDGAASPPVFAYRTPDRPGPMWDFPVDPEKQL